MFRKLMCLIMSVLIFVCCPYSVSAAGSNTGRITIRCGVPDMQWDIYRVADANADGTLTLSSEFSEYSIPDFFDFREEVQYLAFTFENYIINGGFSPCASGSTDENGEIIFSGLEEGWYTAVPYQVTAGEYLYTSSPVMVCISSEKIYSSVWGTDITVSPKNESRKKLSVSKKEIIIKLYPDTEPNSSVSQSPVEITIYKNDEKYDTVILDPSDDWTCVIDGGPDDDVKWTVIIEDIPENTYPVYYRETENNNNIPVEIITIWQMKNNPTDGGPVVTEKYPVTENYPESETETVTEYFTENSSLPQTGQLWWPVPVLAAAGAALLAAGCIFRGKDGDE